MLHTPGTCFIDAGNLSLGLIIAADEVQVLVNAQARCVDLATCYVQDRGITLILSPGMVQRLRSLLETRIFPADQVRPSILHL